MVRTWKLSVFFLLFLFLAYVVFLVLQITVVNTAATTQGRVLSRAYNFGSSLRFVVLDVVEQRLLESSSKYQEKLIMFENYILRNERSQRKPVEPIIFNANTQCDHVKANGSEIVQFFDVFHAIHGSLSAPVSFLNCAQLEYYLTSSNTAKYPEFTVRVVRFAKRCMRCRGSRPKSEQYFEELRQRYVYKNKIESIQANGIRRIVENRSLNQKMKRVNTQGLPVITVGLAVCGRKIESLEEYILLQNVFPAYAQYLEKGFEYWFLLGADEGDPLFDVKSVHEEVAKSFNGTIGAAALQLGVHVQMRILTFPNPAQKPGPAFNIIMAAAYMDGLYLSLQYGEKTDWHEGSDYFYRSNDDTVPVSYWARSFVQILRSNYPTNFGIVGPTAWTDTGGNSLILTHDFVSRVHFQIFDTYYPVSLADWMMDDWASSVYGNHHTCRLPLVLVNHTTLSQNSGKPRYKVDTRVNCLLVYEQYLADKAIHRWMNSHGLSFEHGQTGRVIERNDSVSLAEFIRNYRGSSYSTYSRYSSSKVETKTFSQNSRQE